MPAGSRSTLTTLFILAALLFVYLPALTGHYFYHDDVNFFLTSPHQPYPKSYQLSLAIGRFVGAPVYALQGRLVNHVADLNAIRWIGFLQVLVCVYLMRRLLRRNGWPSVPASVLSALIVTLPSFQILVAMAGYAFQLTGVLLALLAATCADGIPAGSPRRAVTSWQLWLALLFLLAAIATHPSTAMFYWTGAAMILVRSPGSPMRPVSLKAAALVGTGAVGMGLYAVILKATRHLHPPAQLGFYNPYELNTAIGKKAAWFLSEPLVNALNLWNIFPSAPLTALSAAGVLLIGCAAAISLWRRSPSAVVLRTSLLAGVLILSFSTNLLAVSDAPFYRCCIALSSVILVYWFAAGLWCCERLPSRAVLPTLYAALMIAGLTALAAARHTLIQYRVYPSRMETRLISDEMRRRNVFQFGRVHVYRPDRKTLDNRYDEFGGPTASFRGDLVGLVMAGIREQAKGLYRIEHLEYNVRQQQMSLVLTDKSGAKRAFHVRITGDARSTPIHGTVPTLIVNLPQLYAVDGPLHYLRKD
ncbi:MAG: hypothetical protein KC900_03615 [Candidatus Omnitrophica bacterium]|nr:hypothetical protein [Candidatus Omnitrophota bacterium]